MMKLKNWASITLLIILSIFMLMIFTEPIKWNVIGIVGSAICVYLLTKYSKLCD